MVLELGLAMGRDWANPASRLGHCIRDEIGTGLAFLRLHPIQVPSQMGLGWDGPNPVVPANPKLIKEKKNMFEYLMA